MSRSSDRLRSDRAGLEGVEDLGNSPDKNPARSGNSNQPGDNTLNKTIALEFSEPLEFSLEILVKVDSEHGFNLIFDDNVVTKHVLDDGSPDTVVFGARVAQEYGQMAVFDSRAVERVFPMILCECIAHLADGRHPKANEVGFRMSRVTLKVPMERA